MSGAWCGAAEAEVAARVLEAIGKEAAAVAPRECCGALIGRMVGGGTRIEAFEAVGNRSPAAASGYAIAADDVLRVQRRWEREGLDVVGFYHSHPTSAAVPSSSDAALAVPGYIYLIAGVVGAERARGWRTETAGGALREVRLRRVAG